MTNKKFLVFSFIIGLFNFLSCNNYSCKNKAGIEVSELIHIHLEKQPISYCDLLSNAVQKDTSALNSLLRLNILDGAGYDHAGVLVDLFKYLGEDFVINSTSNFSKKDINHIKSYLIVGLEYSEKAESIKSYEDMFPVLNQTWK